MRTPGGYIHEAMNAITIPPESYNDTGTYHIYKKALSETAILYIHYFFGIVKRFLIFLFRDYIYNIFILSSKLTYLLLTSRYKYISFYPSSGSGGIS